MGLKPTSRFKGTMTGLAVVFGGIAAVKLFHHELYTGLSGRVSAP